MKQYNKQHPVPQHIASYQFHLVGQMTLKQFLEVAAGVITGWVIHSLAIPGLVKWPLIVFVVLLGAGLAFYPIEERPLDRWIINFFKSIYSPTLYVWKKRPQLPDLFLQKSNALLKIPQTPLGPQDKTKLEEYLQTLPSTPPLTQWEKIQLDHLKKVSQLLGLDGSSLQADVFQPTQETQSFFNGASPGIRLRRLGEKTTTPQFYPKPIKVETIKDPVGQTKPVVEPAPPLTPPMLVKSRFPQKLDPAIAAQFSTTLPIPSTPEIPNVVVGMVLTNMDKIVPNALIEIINSSGETVRALKSNKLGQFFSASALKNGQYQIKTERPDYEFDIMEFKAEGKVVLPIKIKAKKRKDV